MLDQYLAAKHSTSPSVIPFQEAFVCLCMIRDECDISSPNYWRWIGFGTCALHQDLQRRIGESFTYLDDIIPTEVSRLSMLDEIVKR